MAGKWEYRIVRVAGAPAGQVIGIQKPHDPLADVDGELRYLGEAGWELVSVTEPFLMDRSCPPYAAILFLKRPKTD